MPTACRLLFVIALVAGLAACSSAYYGTLEKFGIEKRDILVDRIDEARDSQQEAAEQFASALEQFTAIVAVDGGELEQVYHRLSGEFEDSEARATEVRDRIESVERVAEDLFAEWEEELEQYSSAELRRSSARSLRETQDRYRTLIAAMHRAEGRMAPVLDRFRDQVLFLKHNLNARAIASLRGELATIESDVDALITEMNRAIREAEAFIRDFRGT